MEENLFSKIPDSELSLFSLIRNAAMPGDSSHSGDFCAFFLEEKGECSQAY